MLLWYQNVRHMWFLDWFRNECGFLEIFRHALVVSEYLSNIPFYIRLSFFLNM